MARNKRKRFSGDKEPPLGTDPPRKRPKTRGSDVSTSKGGAAQASSAGGAPTTVTLEVILANWFSPLPANHGMDMG